MAFPETAILDVFDRADEVLSQSADWWDTSGFEVALNRALCTDNNLWEPTSWLTAGILTDCEAYMPINNYGASPGSESAAVWARFDPVASSGYRVTALRNLGIVTLYRQSGGGASGLAFWTPGLAVGDSIGIRCVGTTITAYHKPAAGAWATLGSVIDATYASGYVGMGATFDVEIDEFGGGATAGGAFPATPVLDTFIQTDTNFAPPNSDWANLSALWVLSQECAPPAYYRAPTTGAVWGTPVAGLQGELYFTHSALMDDGDSLVAALGGDGGPAEAVMLFVARDDVGGDSWIIINGIGGGIGPVIQDVLAGDGIGLSYDDATGRAQAYHYTAAVGAWVPILTGLLVGSFPTSSDLILAVEIASGAIDDFGGGATSGIVMPTSTGPTPRVAAWQRPATRVAEEV